MLQIYRFLINFIFLLSPIILIFRLIKNKEDIKRFKEKFCFFSKKEIMENSCGFMGPVLVKFKV